MGNHEKVFGVCENKCFVEVRPKADTYGKNDVYNKNETYSKEEINTSLAGKAPSNHNHDDRYYTESEMDSKLGGKANSSHRHDDIYYNKTEIFNMLEDYFTDVFPVGMYLFLLTQTPPGYGQWSYMGLAKINLDTATILNAHVYKRTA